MNRRIFISGLTVTVAAIALSPSVAIGESQSRIIYADGEHDDTEALNAWIEGKEVQYADGTPVGLIISGQTFYIGGSLYPDRRPKHLPALRLTDCYMCGSLYRNHSAHRSSSSIGPKTP